MTQMGKVVCASVEYSCASIDEVMGLTVNMVFDWGIFLERKSCQYCF